MPAAVATNLFGLFPGRASASTSGPACSRARVTRGPRAPRAIEQSEVGASSEPFYIKGVPTTSAWELDFCSRPLLDERKKKVWELLICDAERTFEYSEYFPNNKINSATLKQAIDRIVQMEGAVKPDKVRFFRGQMQTIITRALGELDIRAVPSRRCFSIIAWLKDRMDNHYPALPGYDAASPTLFTMDTGVAEDLPDALRGESWAFVQLPLSAVLAELESVERGEVFGSTFPLETAGIEVEEGDDPLVPGVAVFSRRALPLAGWTNGLELSRMRADAERGFLMLETGVSQRWRYSSFPRTPQAREEAAAWSQAVDGSQGLHFLAIQEDPEGEEVAGLWLMRDVEIPKI
ncbi:unnamed protein product [Pedinophyceae sp. YPF-701]|nr:unnamed protein product [Pedinophyceae sp. YPF-701]